MPQFQALSARRIWTPLTSPVLQTLMTELAVKTAYSSMSMHLKMQTSYQSSSGFTYVENLARLLFSDFPKGGGYGAGNGREDLTQIINSNNNSFVGVAIQYRVTTAS